MHCHGQQHARSDRAHGLPAAHSQRRAILSKLAILIDQVWHQSDERALELRILLGLERGIWSRVKYVPDDSANEVRDLGFSRKLSKSYIVRCGDCCISGHSYRYVLHMAFSVTFMSLKLC